MARLRIHGPTMRPEESPADATKQIDRSNQPRIAQRHFVRALAAAGLIGVAQAVVARPSTAQASFYPGPPNWVDVNFGVGTSSPQQNLSVVGGVNVDQNDDNNGTAQPGITFGSNSGEGIASKRTAGGNQYGLDFYTSNGTVRMSITNGGSVGIGTTNPYGALHLQRDGQAQFVMQDTSGSTGQTVGRVVYDGGWNVPGGGWQFQRMDDDGSFVANLVTVVQNTGYVGINTLAPIFNLDVAGFIRSQGTTYARLLFECTASGGRRWDWETDATGKATLADLTAGAQRLVVDTSGNVGIATSSPAATLHLGSGAIQISSTKIADGGGCYYA